MRGISKAILGIAALALVPMSLTAQETKPAEKAPESKPAAVAKEKAPAGGEMVALEIELPKPMFIGTPKNIRVENLERPNAERPPVMVPKGIENIALDKEVSGSDEEPIIGELELITDGDKEASDGSYVELGPGLQYIQIDLEEKSKIHAVAVWHYHQQARVYHDVVVQVADDPDFITNVQTIFNNDHDNSAGLGVGEDKAYIETNQGRVMDAKGAKGRYVRLYSDGSTGNDMNHYIEVEVYGKSL